MNKNKKKNNKGFSLIELIIAIAILIILTGLLAPQFMKYIEKSREAKDMQAMDTVYSSVQAALANEAAYDEMIGETADIVEGEITKAGIFHDSIEDIINTEDSSFALEVKSLLGSSDIKLRSKKASDTGEICVAVQYKEGKENITVGDNTTTVDTFGGFEVMVYCGTSTGKKIDGLQYIGADLSAALPQS